MDSSILGTGTQVWIVHPRHRASAIVFANGIKLMADALLQIGAAVGVPAAIVERVGIDKMDFPWVASLVCGVHD